MQENKRQKGKERDKYFFGERRKNEKDFSAKSPFCKKHAILCNLPLLQINPTQ